MPSDPLPDPSDPPRARAPLPEDPWSLPAPGPDWDAALTHGLEAIGLVLSPEVHRALDAHTRLLLAWTGAINLTALRDPAAVARLHLVDSLTAVPVVQRMVGPVPSIVDIGSGGGFPGLPLGAAVPASRVTLVDSVAKKVRFLQVAAAAVASALDASGGTSPRIEAITGRAEDLARDPVRRGAWDVVTARAVASLGELVELSMPLLRPGGCLVAWKRDDGSGGLATETTAAARIAQETGAGRPEVLHDPEAAIPGHRLIVVRKERSTPDRYPRTPVERRRRPDG